MQLRLTPHAAPSEFFVALSHRLSPQAIADACRVTLVSVKLPDQTTLEHSLADLFTLTQASDSDSGWTVAPVAEGLDRLAMAWCQRLAAANPKTLPRSQRPIVALLRKLAPEPTGNTLIDRGRRMILDHTIATLWPHAVGALRAMMTRIRPELE